MSRRSADRAWIRPSSWSHRRRHGDRDISAHQPDLPRLGTRRCASHHEGVPASERSRSPPVPRRGRGRSVTWRNGPRYSDRSGRAYHAASTRSCGSACLMTNASASVLTRMTMLETPPVRNSTSRSSSCRADVTPPERLDAGSVGEQGLRGGAERSSFIASRPAPWPWIPGTSRVGTIRVPSPSWPSIRKPRREARPCGRRGAGRR